MQRVQEAAGEIGFYGMGTIEARKRESIPRYRLGFLLQQSHREWYQLMAKKIREAARQRRDDEIEPVIEFADRLDPEHIAERLMLLGEACDAVSVIAADHPLVSQTIQTLKARGKPVVSYITDQSAPDRAGYVGTDNWKLGRTAAWFIAQTTCTPRDGWQSSSATTDTSARTFPTPAFDRMFASMRATLRSRTVARPMRTRRRRTGSSQASLRRWMI